MIDTLVFNREKLPYNDFSKYKYLERMAKYLQTTGKLRTTSYLFELANRGFIKNLSVDKVVEFCDKMDQIITSLNNAYGENWDFVLQTSYDDNSKKSFLGFTLNIVIHYDEILITNSKEQEHLIKDLFVILSIHIKKSSEEVTFLFSDPYGFRSTLSYEEWYSGYFHSHLEKDIQCWGPLPTGPFCTGSNEITDLRMRLNSSFDIGNFELLLLTIDSMVSWESLEGVPHMKMENIRVASKWEKKELHSRYFEESFNQLETNIKSLEACNFIFSEGRYKLVANQNLSSSLQAFFKSNRRLKKYLVSPNTEDGEYFGFDIPSITCSRDIKQSWQDSNNSKKPFVLFRNKKFFLTVSDFDSSKLPDTSNYIIYPKFLDYVSEQISQKLYVKNLQIKAAEQYYQNKSVERYIQENPVSL